jgi:hypothetical protein
MAHRGDQSGHLDLSSLGSGEVPSVAEGRQVRAVGAVRAVSWPAHLSVATVRTLLDPLERNISFGDNWVDRAKSDLVGQLEAKVTALPPADLLLVSAAEKLRNAIAHRSSSSVDELNSAL